MKANQFLALAAIVARGISSSSAQTWTPTSAPATNWVSIASSADGTKLVAAVKYGGLYISTNSDATWNQSSAPDANWYSVASSANGMKLVAVESAAVSQPIQAQPGRLPPQWRTLGVVLLVQPMEAN